jgi:GT2 family glycosyltransferase
MSWTACHPTFGRQLSLTPVSRRPLRLSPRTIETVLGTEPVMDPVLRPTSTTLRPASIVLVTWNNLLFNRLCLDSILSNTESGTYELIVVDNGSTDGTVDYLRQIARTHAALNVLVNADNRGFAKAVNQGLALAMGEVLVILNNDTLVPPGWLPGLMRHLDDERIGLVGPVTNRIDNEAQIDTNYRKYGQFLDFAQARAADRHGEWFAIPVAAMFCLAMRRDAYQAIGPLDERFETGLFEDDDYSMRARRAGYLVACAEDVFVHHFGEASFGQLHETGEFKRLLRENQGRYERKWGMNWERHRRRVSPSYLETVAAVRRTVRDNLPKNSTVLVVSRGDDDLVRFDDQVGWHFPQDNRGDFAGHYPADSMEGIRALEGLRERGASYLLFPKSAFWWLEHYDGFRRYLEENYAAIPTDHDHCVIFSLRSSPPGEERLQLARQQRSDWIPQR